MSTRTEHYGKAEGYAFLAARFEKRLFESTQTRPNDPNTQRRAPVPLGVINYIEFLQRQALLHATLASSPDPAMDLTDEDQEALDNG